MFAAAPALDANAAPDPAAEGLAWLHEMAAMGMQAARKVFGEIMAEPEPAIAEPQPPQPDRFAALHELERLSRWVRLTIALRARLAEGPRRAPHRDLNRLQPPTRSDRVERGYMDAREALRIAIERETFVESERDEALALVGAWLKANPIGDFITRPVSDIVRRLCRHIDIPFDPALWADEPWALEERADPPITSAYRGWSPPGRAAPLGPGPSPPVHPP